MAITESQRVARRKSLGSSDIAAIMGVDPFRNAYDVWLEKTGKLEPETGESSVKSRGNYLEPAILNFAEDQIGELDRSPERLEFVLADTPLVAHPDAIVVATGHPVEAKSKGIYSKEIWGTPGTDEVPDRAIIQAHVHLLCMGADFCHVPTYLDTREFQLYGVAYDAEVGRMIIDSACSFWQDNVQKDIPPAVVPSLSIVRRVIRVPNSTAVVPDELIEKWIAAKDAAATINKHKDSAEAALLAALGDSEAGESGVGTLTYFLQNRAEYTVKAGSYRVLRLKKAK